MGILFLIALVLAWPTFGLSIVAWGVIALAQSKGKIDAIDARNERKALIEPVFGGRYSEFFQALDVPTLPFAKFADAEADRCGRHILTYLAHNPSEWALFLKGLKRWRRNGSPELVDAATVARLERENGKAEVHLVSFRALEALTSQNPGLTCFNGTDLYRLAADRRALER